ncbi:hypothetical protein BOX07_gp28 [Pseudoalteromonas phage PH1]|uniref:hypothetical protein n=1 Tax=Pseudoalteromonas phage PH1 TaxID=1874540 RepID=UPI0008199335|nr:hypothetical protein BOX07_gp28 [Pseudoalteromonas phage PH1]ANY29539.1 hypothetical protein [Pseudoalteromonas phage PH1]
MSAKTEHSSKVFRVNVVWSCPFCGTHNHDKNDSNDGVVDELYCYDCREVFSLEENKA